MPGESRDLLELLVSRFGYITYSPVLVQTFYFLKHFIFSNRIIFRVESLYNDNCRVCLVLLELLVRLESPETE